MGLKEGISRANVERMLSTASLKTDEEWKINEHLVKKWFDDLKAWEQKETFNRAFTDNRMTIRGMGVETKHREAVANEFKVTGNKATPKVVDNVRGAIGTFSRPESGITDMKIYYGIKGVLARGTPDNFERPEVGTRPVWDSRKKFDPTAMPPGWSKKYWLGLHDLSATMLRSDWTITEQQKYYTNSTWVFMPVALEEDHVLFNLLNAASREMGASPAFERYVRVIAGQMTRIKAAQAEDMHTSYTDTGDGDFYHPKAGKIKYGLGGYGVGGWNDDPLLRRTATDLEVAQRKLNALRYKSMLRECVKGKVNEIVMKYRRHGDGRTVFPMFATQKNKDSEYVVIDRETLKPTGQGISLKGVFS